MTEKLPHQMYALCCGLCVSLCVCVWGEFTVNSWVGTRKCYAELKIILGMVTIVTLSSTFHFPVTFVFAIPLQHTGMCIRNENFKKGFITSKCT